jgi:hypothetical protein
MMTATSSTVQHSDPMKKKMPRRQAKQENKRKKARLENCGFTVNDNRN